MEIYRNFHPCMWRERDRTLRLLILWGLVAGVQLQVQQQQSGQINQNLGLPEAGTLFTGTGTNLYYGVNLVPFGPEVGDQEVIPGMLTSGQTIDLHMYFPFYGGLYNYTTISVNGYIGFAVVLDQGPTINIGPDATDWPKHQDPAMIAPYLCKQQPCMWRERDRTLRLLILWGLVAGVQQQVQQQQSGQINQNLGLPEAGTLFTGTGTNLYYGVNLVPFGPEVGDQEVIPGMLTSGQTIDLHMYFPFYGGLYNYTTISVNGYIGFAVVLDQGPTINIGPDATDWPKHQDPAMIAPYLCKQQIPQDMNPGMRSG
ncbi:hypothetical protein ANCDUO_16039, partial [Ancylostoma duodenale]